MWNELSWVWERTNGYDLFRFIVFVVLITGWCFGLMCKDGPAFKGRSLGLKVFGVGILMVAFFGSTWASYDDLRDKLFRREARYAWEEKARWCLEQNMLRGPNGEDRAMCPFLSMVAHPDGWKAEYASWFRQQVRSGQ
jgi:hypothetical protein